MNERKKSSVSFWHSMKTSFMLVVVAVAAAVVVMYTLKHQTDLFQLSVGSDIIIWLGIG